MTSVVCGSSECPTCGRVTEVIFGPCVECCERHAQTGKFLRRVKVHFGGSGSAADVG